MGALDKYKWRCVMENFRPTFLYIKQHSITGKLYFGKTCKDPVTYMGSGLYWKDHITQHGKEHVITLWYCLFYDRDELNKFALKFSQDNNIVESQTWANLMDEDGIGGGGNGQKRGFRHSEESRKLMSEKRNMYLKGKPSPSLGTKLGPFSQERRLAHSQAIKKWKLDNPEKELARKQKAINARRETYSQNPELRLKHSQSGEKNGMFGVIRPEEWKKTHSEFMKEHNPMKGRTGSLSPNFGKPPYNKGKTIEELHGDKSDDVRRNISQAAKAREKITCPHCGKTGSISNMKRWHMENCKCRN